MCVYMSQGCGNKARAFMSNAWREWLVSQSCWPVDDLVPAACLATCWHTPANATCWHTPANATCWHTPANATCWHTPANASNQLHHIHKSLVHAKKELTVDVAAQVIAMLDQPQTKTACEAV